MIASAGLHLLLVVTLLVASAFQRSRDQAADTASAPLRPGPVVDILRLPPEAGLPVAAPAAPATTPAAVQPSRAPRLVADTPPPRPDHDSLEPELSRPRLPQISTNLVSRPGNSRTVLPQSRDIDDRRDVVGQQIRDILTGISGGAPIDISLSPGGGSGAGGDSYQQLVRDAYSRSWNPREVPSGEGIASVKVTIASDGKVVSASLINPSGNAALDNSVRRALAQVRFIRAFEPGANETQRTYSINFDLRAREL